MVFKMLTLDLTQGLNEDFAPLSLPSSPSCTYTVCCTATLALAASTTIEFARRIKPRGFPITRDEDEFQLQRGRLSEFTLKELRVATGEFHAKNLVGRGGWGKVYRGQLASGFLAAIKRSKEEVNIGTVLSFHAEVKVGNLPNNLNVAPLLGFYMSPKFKEYLLVYPFFVNGSLADCLRARAESQPPLSWCVRMKIAVGVARGLRHLHSHNVIHRDIKAANILLDERFEPLIGDFGIAVFLFAEDTNRARIESVLADSERGSADNIAFFSNSRTMSAETESNDTALHSTAVRGTIGHVAPEYLSTGQCSKKNDIFGFGVMLLELLTGQRAFDGHVMLLDWVKGLLKEERWQRLIDVNLQGGYDEGEVDQLIKIALMCTSSDPKRRPNSRELVRFLKGDGWRERWEESPQEDYNIMQQRDEQRLSLFSEMHGEGSITHLLPEELSGPR